MRTPFFWHSRNLVALALLPVAWLYDLARRLRNASITSADAGIPVICIGNLTAGGAGKTPVALAIGEMLKARGIEAWFLSRGHGGRLRGPVIVDPGAHTAGDVGDEPLLLAQTLPTVVAKDRLAGARFAKARGARAVVMDDGLQHFAIAKTASLAVVDGTYGFGNALLLPAGPLREPVAEGMARADAAVAVNAPEDFFIPEAKQIFRAHTVPRDADFVKDRRWVAFCGIAYPQKFFATLHNLGGHVLSARAFADHHPYGERELRSLREEAARLGAGLITTAKDMARIPSAQQDGIRALHIALVFEDGRAVEDWLLAAIGGS